MQSSEKTIAQCAILFFTIIICFRCSRETCLGLSLRGFVTVIYNEVVYLISEYLRNHARAGILKERSAVNETNTTGHAVAPITRLFSVNR
jgi:hypothetical protein